MKVILYANDYGTIEALQSHKSVVVPVELSNKPRGPYAIQVLIDLEEYRLEPSNRGYKCWPIRE